MRSGSPLPFLAAFIVAHLFMQPTARAGAVGDLRPPAIESACRWDRAPFTDTLRVIWRPLATLPALVRSGDTLSVWAHAPDGPGPWSAQLRLESRTISLPPAGGGFRPDLGRWVLGFAIPPDLPEEIYDLILSPDAGSADTTRHSVKVLSRFREDYDFAQVTDTHLPAESFSSNSGWSPCDTTAMGDFDAIISQLNLIHPEFILHTGDIVNEGDLESFDSMYEMGRARTMVYRLHDPLFLVSGNHDIGGWSQTPVPAGTARREWWRNFGWPCLGNPPAGAPDHSQVYSFDYGTLHCIGLEAYNNYDRYLAGQYGSDSFTSEELSWLMRDLAAARGKHKLLFFHYDFQSQIDPAALGVDGAIWGHIHSVPEGNRNAHPFNLGLQSAVHGRTFRIFHVHDGQITPGPMHRAGATGDSLSASWSGPNDGSRQELSVRVRNRFGESWNHARLLFRMAGLDSAYAAEGGAIAQAVPMGEAMNVYVDCRLPAASETEITVHPAAPVHGDSSTAAQAPWLSRPNPSPFHPGGRPLAVWYSLPSFGQIQVGVYDAEGRRMAGLFQGPAGSGPHLLEWDGMSAAGTPVPSGIYLIRLRAGGTERARRVVVLR